MRVTFSDPLTITEQFNLDRFNEVRLVAGARPQQFTQTNAPDVAGFAAHLAEVGARTITYDDGLNAQNAAIGGLDGFGPVYDTASAPRMGDVIENLSGVLSYQWAGNPSSGATWRVRAASDGENAVTPANPRPETPDVGGALKVASFNVLNFFTTLDLSGATTINGLDPRGADSAAEFDRQLEKLVTAITALDADLLGLIELENDPAGDASLTALTGALNAELGAGTYQYLDTGVIGGDAIKVGFLYRPGALAPAGDFALLDNTVDPRFDSDNQRPTLAQTFESVADGAAFTATVSHFKSKGSPAGAPGDTNAGDGQGFSNGTRTQAAEALVDWLAGDPTGSGDADFLILGDLNSYAQEDPITAILSGADDVAGTDDDFVNLVARFGGEGLKLGDAVFEPFAVLAVGFKAGEGGGVVGFGSAPGGPGAADGGERGIEAAETVQKCSVAAGGEQAALVILAMDFDKEGGDIAQQGDADRLIVDEGAAAAIGLERALEDDLAIAFDGVFGQSGMGRVLGRRFEGGCDAALIGTGADQP